LDGVTSVAAPALPASIRGGLVTTPHAVAVEDINIRALDFVGVSGSGSGPSSSHVPVVGILSTPSVASTEEEADYYRYIVCELVGSVRSKIHRNSL
jgi:hypothetical protein